MLVLAKALNQKFAHQAGYALINGRWKKTTPDMKGVKNAPKAAHPKAGGKGHKPYAMPQEESSQLLYPAEKEATNKDIKHFNQKHVPNLLQHAANGDIAAILGSSYGVNTHGKKLVAIANYLLEQMGSQEKVSAGQKAGEHPAIATYEREPETVDQMAEQAVEAVAQEAKAATKPATGNLTAKQQAIVSGIESYLGLPPIEAYKVKNNVITIEIGDLKQHQLHAIENYGTQFGYFKTEPGGAKKLSLIMPKDGPSPSPEKKNAAKEEVQKASTPAAEAPKPGEIVMPKFESGKNSTGVRTAYEAQAQKVIDATSLAELEAIKSKAKSWKGITPNSKKLLNLYGQKLALLTGENPNKPLVQSEEPSPLSAVEIIATSPAQPDTAEGKPAPKASVSKKAMDAIDWSQFAVAENIKNAKSYNAQIAAIKAAGEVGNINGILAMTYGKNTYGLKVAKAANNALAALGYPDIKVVIGKDAVHPMLGQFSQAEKDQKASAEVEQQKTVRAEEGPQEGDTRMGKNGMQVFKDGRWHNQETGEPLKDQPVAGEFKKGQKLSISDMPNLPAGSIIQTYDKDGKPYLKVLMGHATAWPISKKGEPLAKPFQAGQYLKLIGFGGNTKTPDNLGYISDYHHSEYPTELVELGKPNHLTQKQQNVIKNMWNGVLSTTPDAGVYPTNTSAVIVADPKNPGSGMWVNEKGDWGHISGFSNTQNEVYQQIMAGKTPSVNLAESLGLQTAAPEPGTKTFSNPPQTGDAFIDGICEDIQNDLNAGNWALAVDNINDMVTVIRDDQNLIDAFQKVDLSAWIIEAVTAAKKELGDISVKSLPTPPQIKQERAPTPEPQLPEFNDVAEFNEWAKTKGEAFIEQASTYYGSDLAFSESSVGKLYDSWAEKSQAAAKSEQIATKHERKQEKKAILNDYAMWESAFDALTDAKDEKQADAIAGDWMTANGHDAPQLVVLAEAMKDNGFNELANEFFIAGKKAYGKWWSETYGTEPEKPLVSPTSDTVKTYGTKVQTLYNVIAEEVHKGKESDPDVIAKHFNELSELHLSEPAAVQVKLYQQEVNKWLVEDGPKEGDTKQGKGGILVFHNGHWILQQDMPETSANGSAGSEIVALKQALAGANGDDATSIGLEFIKDNHGDKGAYTTVIDNILKMNSGHVYAASEIGQAYFKKHGKPLNLPIKPDVGFYSTEATDFQGYAIAATLAKDENSKKLLIEAMKYEQNVTPSTTINGTKYKEYMAEVLDKLTAAPGKPKNMYDLGLVFNNAKDNLETLMAVQEYVAKKGDNPATYQDIVKAAGDNVAHIPVLQSILKDSINMHGVPQGIPKASYKGDSMADADALDGLAAMAMLAKYTDSPEMKEAVLNSVKESAYALMANQGTDVVKMSMTDYAISTMTFVQDQITGAEEPAPAPEPAAPELGNIDLKLLDDIKSIAETKTGLQKVVKASVACKEYYDANPDKVDAVSTIKSVLIINDFTPVAIEGILTAIKNTVAEEDAKKADEGQKEGDGPKEGDMKPGANGMLILKNGRWVRANPDEIPAPDFAALGLSAWQQDHYMKYVDNLKAKLTKGGGTKGVIMQKADGSMLIYGEFGMKIKVSTEYGPTAPGKKALAQYASMMLMANGIKVKSGYNPEVNGTYAMNGVAQLMNATAATSNPAENGLAADGPMEVKKYQWKKKEPISVDEWTVTGGNQGGSNEGMKMKDADGQEWYVKFPDNEEHAKAEVLAAKLYSAAGLSAQDAMIVTKDGKMAIASKWENIKKAKTHAALAKAKGMLEGFAVDAWLGNWDVVGLAKDNVQLKDDGTIHRVDAGGSLMFRAQGAKKEFGPVVKELESLMDPKMNANSAAVFGGMTEADIAASVSKVLAISDAKIAHMVNQYGPGDEKAKKELVETLIKRKEYLAEKYPEAEQIIKMQKFKPEKISTPPDFLNWSGVGKSGPSSKEFLNKGNHDAAQAIYSAALTGDPEAIRGLTAPTFDKDTGAVTGQVPVLDHPSQHIKGYAMQAINEIKSQLTGHEAEQFRIGGDHPLYSMHEEYKPENWSGNDADKIGNLLVLGHPGIVEPEDLGITKTTFKAGTLTTNTYAKAAQEVWEKLPMTQKQAVQAYTGSSYKQMNSGLWKGNPSAEAKAAAQALSGMGHEISPGTTFGRKFSLGSGDLSKLKASVGKVIMEPAIMSTSISPDVWSGNIHLKMTAGPGVKGIYAGAGSLPSGGSISHHTGEKEIILPPNTRLLITKVNESGTKDADGFGGSGMTVVECIILPSV